VHFQKVSQIFQRLTSTRIKCQWWSADIRLRLLFTPCNPPISLSKGSKGHPPCAGSRIDCNEQLKQIFSSTFSPVSVATLPVLAFFLPRPVVAREPRQCVVINAILLQGRHHSTEDVVHLVQSVRENRVKRSGVRKSAEKKSGVQLSGVLSGRHCHRAS